MKIAFVHSFYSSSVPSGENMVVGLQIEALRSAGHQVHLVDARTDELSQSKLFNLKTAANVAIGTGQDPTERLKDFGPDVVHVHNLFPNFGTRWLKNWDGPIVTTSHNFRPLCSNGTLFRDSKPCSLCPDQGQHNAVKNRCYKGSRLKTLPLAISNVGGLTNDPLLNRSNRIIFLSDRARETYEKYGLPSSKTAIVANFVARGATSKKSSTGNRSWIYVGRLSEEKGILNLVEAWPPGKSLKIYGSGPLLEQVRDAAAKHDEISLHGNVPHEQVLDALTTATGLVLPSLWAEGIPTVYLEAIAAGIPVLAKSGNSAADDILKWAPSLVYAEDSDLAGRLDSIELNSGRLSLEASKHYLGIYTPEIWIEKIIRVYEEAIRSSH